MSYIALARKWRPRTFSQLVGQEHITKALNNSLKQQRLHHAYLFTGTRGVGKTSIARILAKSLNCEQRIVAEPCLKCVVCEAIEQGRFIDLVEIDGASRTRVEDTRELLDNVQYAPASGRFKIYLIDEVHMLSQHSFNALLKTLEEPPAHVKFILATTDPQKLPITILSRCLQFNLRHLPSKHIEQHLEHVLKQEEISWEAEALCILAKAADGSMRDALSLLDQAITSCDDLLTSANVKQLLGYTQQDYALQLLTSIALRDGASILSISEKIAYEGGHFVYVLDEILNYLHTVALYQVVGKNDLIGTSETIEQLATQFSPEETQLLYQIGLNGREEMHLAPTLVMGFTMTLIRMLAFRPMPIEKMKYQVPDPVSEPAVAAINSPKSETQVELMPQIAPTKDSEQQSETKPTHHNPAPTNNTSTCWVDIIAHLKLTGLALNAVENAELISKDEREIVLGVNAGHLSLFTPTVIERIEIALSKYYQQTIKLTLNTAEVIKTSPAQQKVKALQEQQSQAEDAIQNDPVLQQLQQDFSATVVKNSIVPLKDDL